MHTFIYYNIQYAIIFSDSCSTSILLTSSNAPQLFLYLDFWIYELNVFLSFISNIHTFGHTYPTQHSTTLCMHFRVERPNCKYKAKISIPLWGITLNPLIAVVCPEEMEWIKQYRAASYCIFNRWTLIPIHCYYVR